MALFRRPLSMLWCSGLRWWSSADGDSITYLYCVEATTPIGSKFHYALLYLFLVMVLQMVTKVTPNLIALPVILNLSRRSFVMVSRSTLRVG